MPTILKLTNYNNENLPICVNFDHVKAFFPNGLKNNEPTYICFDEEDLGTNCEVVENPDEIMALLQALKPHDAQEGG